MELRYLGTLINTDTDQEFKSDSSDGFTVIIKKQKGIKEVLEIFNNCTTIKCKRYSSQTWCPACNSIELDSSIHQAGNLFTDVNLEISKIYINKASKRELLFYQC